MPHSPPGDQGRLAFPHLRLLRRTAVVTAETVARPVSAPWNQLAGQDQLSRPLWDSASDLSPQERDMLRATLDDRDGPMAVLPLKYLERCRSGWHLAPAWLPEVM